MVVLAFRDTAFTFDTTPWFTHLSLENFRYAFDTTDNKFGRSLVNSLLIGAVVTALAMTIGVFAGYAMARLSFRGKGAILAAILGASMFPGVAILTPLFQLFAGWGWLGTYQALILPQISFSLPLAVYTLTSFFSDMPWELEQAARVDGATPGQAFRLVIFPLAAPALFTTAILVFLSSWNEYLLSSVLVQRQLQGGAVHRRAGQVHRRAARGALHPDDGGRGGGDRATGDRGAAVPAAHRQRPDRGRRQGLSRRGLSRSRAESRGLSAAVRAEFRAGYPRLARCGPDWHTVWLTTRLRFTSVPDTIAVPVVPG